MIVFALLKANVEVIDAVVPKPHHILVPKRVIPLSVEFSQLPSRLLDIKIEVKNRRRAKRRGGHRQIAEALERGCDH